MNSKLMAAFNKHAAATFDKQMFLQDLTSKLTQWDLDVDKGLLSLGNKYRWKVQFLGTESSVSNTWRWAWDEKLNQFPKELLTSANLLRKLGKDKDISELQEVSLPAPPYDGQFWAILATGVCNAKAYFRGPYDGGAVFLLIVDDDYPEMTGNPFNRLRINFPLAISTYEISDQKRALLGLAEYFELRAETVGNSVIVSDNFGSSCQANFDEINRLRELTATVTPESIIDDNQTHKNAKKSNPPRVSLARRIEIFFKLYMHHFQVYFFLASALAGPVGIVAGLITWWFTTKSLGLIAGVVVFIALILYLLFPTGPGTYTAYLNRKGWVTVWVSTFNSKKSLSAYLKAEQDGFQSDSGFGPIEKKDMAYAAVDKSFEVSIRELLRGTMDDTTLRAALSEISKSEFASVIVYHDLDYRRLIVPEAVPDTGRLKLIGTFSYTPQSKS